MRAFASWALSLPSRQNRDVVTIQDDQRCPIATIHDPEDEQVFAVQFPTVGRKAVLHVIRIVWHRVQFRGWVLSEIVRQSKSDFV